MYDVFFLSYDELYADQYWAVLKEQVPSARRCHGVAGIQAAHARCAAMSRTPHFFVVDADNQATKPEVFSYKVPEWDAQYVHLWHATNPVNGLTYGWGGIKLFPKRLFRDLTEQKLDMTTSFPLKIMPEVASINHFNVTPLETWRSAFREAVKLTLNDSEEARQWLSVWMTIGMGVHGEWAVRGAADGFTYAREHPDDTSALMRINDYDWLAQRFASLT